MLIIIIADNNNDVTSCVESCNGVNNDTSGDISTCVVSDNTTSISDNRSDNSNDSSVASGNTNRIFVIGCKNVNSVSSANTPSSNGNNSYIIINIASSVVPDYNVPTIDTVDMNNVNDNIGNLDNGDDSTIRWDDAAAMEDAARDFEEVSFPVPLPQLAQAWLALPVVRLFSENAYPSSISWGR